MKVSYRQAASDDAVSQFRYYLLTSSRLQVLFALPVLRRELR
ncbi:MAG TPA: hypothetical protein VN924_23115 [Bryobacteraceae bacterium]|nr:hypothetical protein [Bryobacteraceae bacterium]